MSMNLVVGQQITIDRKSPHSGRGDRLLTGTVVAVSERFVTVKSHKGYRESILFTDIKNGHAKIVAKKEEPMEKHEEHNELTFAEILEGKGLKGLLSEKMVKRVPREKIVELMGEGYGTKAAAGELGIGLGTYINLKKFYGLMNGQVSQGDQVDQVKRQKRKPVVDVDDDQRIDEAKKQLVEKAKRQEAKDAVKSEVVKGDGSDVVKSEEPAPYDASMDFNSVPKEAVPAEASVPLEGHFTMTEKARIVAPLVVGVANSLVEMMCEKVTVEIRVRRI